MIRSRKLVFSLLLMLCLAAPALAQEGQDENTLTVTPKEAFDMMAGSALQGDPTAMLNLGVFYEQGIGVNRNYSKALEWYLKAAEQGVAEACYNAGAYYEIGMGDQADLVKSADYFEMSADAGLAQGMYKIATMYLNGEGRSVDQAKAFQYMEKAAQAGHGIACNAMGVIYVNGSLDQTKDEAKALEWFMRGADMGNLEAIKNIAVVYKDGIGQPRDAAQSLLWYLIAQKGGYQADDMGAIIDGLKLELGAEQTAKAEQDADAWLADFAARNSQ